MRAVLVAALGLSLALPGVVRARGGPPPQGPAYEEELQRCVDLVNQYRASAHRGVLRRSTRLEEFAAAAARNDGLAHVGHQYFRKTNGGGVSRAENAIPWWSLAWVGSVRDALERGLAMMWDEGPGGGHYENMTQPFTEIGCGIFVHRGEVTIVQEFR